MSNEVTWQASWNGAVLATSSDTVTVEGNQYFPVAALESAYFSPTQTHTVCPWKGTASYYTVTVDGVANVDAAWFYPEPKPEAEAVRDRVAFWKGVEVSRVEA